MSNELIEALKQVKPLKLRMDIYKQFLDLENKLYITEKALKLVCNEVDDARDMLRDCGKPEWASLLNTSVDYFKAVAKEMMKSETTK